MTQSADGVATPVSTINGYLFGHWNLHPNNFAKLLPTAMAAVLLSCAADEREASVDLRGRPRHPDALAGRGEARRLRCRRRAGREKRVGKDGERVLQPRGPRPDDAGCR